MRFHKVVFTSFAQAQLDQIIDRLITDFGNIAAKKFLGKLKEFQELISFAPFTGQKSKIREDLFRVVISRQTTIIYSFSKDTVTLLYFIDNRRAPESIENDLNIL